MANIEVLNQTEREAGIAAAVDSHEESTFKAKVLGKHEETDKQLKITEELEQETLAQNGNVDFDSDIFEEKINELREQRDSTQDNIEKHKIKQQIKLINDVRTEVHIFGFNDVKQSYQDRKNRLENSNTFLNNPHEVQKIKNQKLDDVDPTGTIQNIAKIENIAQTFDKEKILDNIENLKQEHDELIHRGRHDEAKVIFNTSYRDAVIKAYTIAGKAHNEALSRKEKIDKKHAEMVTKLADGRTETPEDLEERRKLQIESQALGEIIQGITQEMIQNELVKEYSLWTHVQRNMENTGEANNTTPEHNPNENNNNSTIERLKKNQPLLKIAVGAVAGIGGAIAGGAIISTGSPIIIPAVIGAGILAKGLREGWIGTGMLDRNINKYTQKINNLPEGHPDRSNLEEKLKTREKWRDLIKEYVKPVGYGFTAGFLTGGIANFALDTTALVNSVYGAGIGAATIGISEGWGHINKKEEHINLVQDLGLTDQEIEELRQANLVINENQIPTGKEKLGKLHRQFHKKVMKEISKENLNKTIYIQKIKEIANEFTTNPNANIDINDKVQEVISASSGSIT